MSTPAIFGPKNELTFYYIFLSFLKTTKTQKMIKTQKTIKTHKTTKTIKTK